MDGLLPGRGALVTGGAGRIGRAIAATLAREGARVAITDLPATHSTALPRRWVWPAFLATSPDPASVSAMVDAAEEAIGPLDILVACAGIFPNCPLLDMELEEWERVFAINVRGVMLCNQAVARRWVARARRVRS